jgi:hypothetical protein
MLKTFTNFDWNITKSIFGIQENNYNISNDILKVYYPKGSYSPSKKPVGGIGFFAETNEIQNSSHIIFNYSVLFDKSFNPNLGGKLPGMYISNNYTKTFIGGSGGKHTNNTSCRIAWRSNFQAEAYLYLPKHIIQHPSYYENAKINTIYGDSLWRGDLYFDKNTWNNIIIEMRLNTFDKKLSPNQDGLLKLTINNKTKIIDTLIWTLDPFSKIETIIFETFFGGSTPKTATPNDTWTYFKNVSIQKIK